MKKWSLLALLAIVIAAGAYFWLTAGSAQSLAGKPLTFAEVRRTTMRDIVSATAYVEPREIIIVSAKTPGTVTRLIGQIGATVDEDEPLALLDEREIALKVEEARHGVQQATAAVKQAEAALAQATATEDAAERYVKIQRELANTVGFRTEREQAEAQYKAAQAGVKAAHAGIDTAKAKAQGAETSLKNALLAQEFARITAPAAQKKETKRQFLILDRKVHEGQFVGPQAGPLFTLAGSLETVKVHAQVAEGDINNVREGLTAVFRISNYNREDIEFEGVVTKKHWQATNIKGAVYYDTVIQVDNKKDLTTNEWMLRPGMTISADIVRVERKSAWRVPIGAMNFKLEDAYQSAAVKARLTEWKSRPDHADWHVLWTWDESNRQPAPIFVRINGLKNGEPGLKDAEGNEVLEWEEGKEPTGPLRVIIGAPPARAPGFFDQPANVKI